MSMTMLSTRPTVRTFKHRNVPAELDMLDSPLLSPTPMGSAIPGSALAERIFNDPSSWETTSASVPTTSNVNGAFVLGDLGFSSSRREDPMAWFADEVDKFHLGSASTIDSSSTSSPSSGGLSRQKSHRRSLMDLSTSRRSVRPISLASLFDRSSDSDFVKDIQSHLHKMNLHDEGIDRAPATADIFSPMSSSTSSSSLGSSTLSTAGTDKDGFVPTPIYSASTTLSFLDLYLDTPSRKNSIRKSLYTRSRPRTPMLPVQVSFDVEGMQGGSEKERPISLLSLADPDMSVEPLKRGSSVPPLDQLPLRTSNVLPPPVLVLSPEPKPAVPPGLSQLISTSEDEEKEKDSSESKNQPEAAVPAPAPRKSSPVRSLPRPAALPAPPPPYSLARTPSPPRRAHPQTATLQRAPHTASTTSTPLPQPQTATVAAASGTSTPLGTPVRRLPTIPPQSAAPCSALPSSLPTSQPSSLPTSHPSSTSTNPASSLLSPEPTLGSQTIVYHGRPMSAVRSPLAMSCVGSPLGPRNRSSGRASLSGASGRASPSLAGSRVVSGGSPGNRSVSGGSPGNRTAMVDRNSPSPTPPSSSPQGVKGGRGPSGLGRRPPVLHL